MAAEEREQNSASEEPEEDGLEPAPGADNASEEDEDEEVEEEAPKPWKRVRDDIYRRQSNVERAIGELKTLMEAQSRALASNQPTTPSKTEDPMLARLKLQQDPQGFIRQIVEQVATDVESRVTSRVKSEGTLDRAKKKLEEEFPELKDSSHPFFEAADRFYADLTQEQGMPVGPQTALVAARLAAAEKPQLREKQLRDRRRNQTENQTRNSIADATKLETGAPRPNRKGSSAELPPLSRDDFQIAKTWGVNLEDPKEAAWIKQEKQRLQGLRIVGPGKEAKE